MHVWIDVVPLGSNRHNVDLIVPQCHACPQIQNVSSQYIDSKFEEVGWLLLRERFASEGKLQNEEIDATPEQLTALGFKTESLAAAGVLL